MDDESLRDISPFIDLNYKITIDFESRDVLCSIEVNQCYVLFHFSATQERILMCSNLVIMFRIEINKESNKLSLAKLNVMKVQEKQGLHQKYIKKILSLGLKYHLFEIISISVK